MERTAFNKRIKLDVRLRDFTTFRIGGKAEKLTIARDSAELKEAALKWRDKITVLGLGSNVLVSDGGVKGLTVIAKNSGVHRDGGILIAESGTPLPRLADAALKGGLSGLEFAAGIPGTVGGAVVMNAGAFGNSVSDVLEWADIVRGGKEIRLSNSELCFVTRGSGIAKGDVVLRAAFRLTEKDSALILSEMQRQKEYREKTQPKGRSAGSVFKAADKAAGYYIDKAGLKGFFIGDAVVSEKHANFIINKGTASSRDTAALIDTVKAEVFVKFGVKLTEEIRYIGEFDGVFR